MAPPGKGYEMTYAQRNRIPILSRFKCRICSKFKASVCFSNKELKDYQNKKSVNPRITDITAQLRCRSCAGDQVHELRCEGQCGLWKALDGFSKTQRTRGSKWCKDCVLWKEAAEPGVPTRAAPNTELAPDEHEAAFGTGSYDDYEGGEGDSDDNAGDCGYFDIPYPNVGDTSIATPASSGVQGVQGVGSESAATQASSTVAPHLRTTTSTSIAVVDRPGYVPPHLRGVVSTTGSATHSSNIPPHLRAFTSFSQAPSAVGDADLASQSSASNPYETDSTAAGSVVEWSVATARRRNNLPPIDPSNASAALRGSQPSGARGSDTWARPAGTRRATPQFPEIRRTAQAQNAYDSDDGETDDEM